MNKLIILYLSILSPTFSWAQNIFIKYQISGIMSLNHYEVDNWSKAKANEYYALRPPIHPFISAGIGYNFSSRHSIILSRKSLEYAIGGKFKHGFSTQTGGGFILMDRFNVEWNLTYCYKILPKRKLNYKLFLGINYLKRIPGWLPQKGSGYIGSDSNNYWVSVTDSDSMNLRSFRPIFGIEGNYNYRKWTFGVNLGFQSPGKAIYRRNISLIEHNGNQVRRFAEVNDGRGIYLGVIVQYNFNKIRKN